MIFETHAHYDDEAFDIDRKELLSSMPQKGIEKVVNICANPADIDRTVELMEEYPHVYGAVGVHPDCVGAMGEEVLDKVRSLCRHSKTVAVGEIGLDYYWDTENHNVQKKWFAAQMEVAREEQMPFVIHSRESARDTLDMMRGLRAGEMYGGVVHCFSYSAEMAREYLNMGLYLGVGGVITFKNARKLKEVVEYAPISQIVLETDSPYLAPVPHRGKRNSSLNIPLIAEEIAQIKGITYDQVVNITRDNAYKLYRLQP